MNHTISCQIISQNPNSVNWIGGFYFEPDQSFNHVFDRFSEVHSPPLGLSLIEVELVSTTPDIAKTGPLENGSRFLEYVSVDCFSLASHASTHHRKKQMLAVFDIGLLIAAVTVDLVSLVLNARRAFRGHGASGVPGISWIAYVVLLEWRKELFFFTSAGRPVLC
jgi:hypothetical protein